MDIAEWLRGLGLSQYEPAFRENAIDGAILPELTSDDLRDLGINLVGHRRRLLAAIAALRAEVEAEARTAEAVLRPNLPELAGGHEPPDPPASDPHPSLPRLRGRGREGAAQQLAEAAPVAERRQLTVMFCDLVGSTPLSTRHDPEDLRGIIGAYHRAVTGIVNEFGGFVARYMGDGVLIYLGYPQAHEDDAERAIRCGLAMAARVSQLNLAEDLHVRIGIATGLVVVGGEVVEHDVVGETPNLAARLQAFAEPDTVVIAAGTRRLVGDLFEYRDLGGVAAKGIADPVSAWQVLRPSAVESRFEALRGPTLTPLVGREEEIDLLLRRWARAKAGDGQVALISGEPGIGKSRITAELEGCLHAEPHIRLRYFCSPYHQDSALFPFIEQLDHAAGFGREDSSATRLEKLETLLAHAAPPDEDVALLSDLLCLPCPERGPLPDLRPQRKKERTLEALLRQLEGLARQQPVLMVFEDAHWADPTSRELLDLTVERVRSLPVLMVVTFRPEFQPPWTGQPQVSVLTLNRLDRHDRTSLVEQIAGGNALPDGVIDQIAERTDGVPLFIEELTKSVVESGVPLVGIPTTLHDSLMARLDRLASVRLVAQIGAAIGRQFPYALLRAVSGLSEDELQTALARLIASELVFQRGTPPDALYTFKHALVQDAAHGSLLRSARQQLHAQIAEALEAHSPELMETQPELFAQHYAEAGLVEKSVAYWGKAGHRSFARSAMAEAAAQFQRGLDQLALLPETPERQHQELELLNTLGVVLFALKGPGAPEMGFAYARALELWTLLGSPPELLGVPYGRLRYLLFRGELDLALSLDEDLLRLSQKRNDAAGLIQGHFSIGRTLMFTGRFGSSRSHLEDSLSLYNAIGYPSLVSRDAGNLQIGLQAYLGISLFCFGYLDKAISTSNAAAAEAARLANPTTSGTCLALRARLLSLAGYDKALGEQADQLVSLATEQGFLQWQAQGTIYRGWAKVRNGDLAEGISLLRRGSIAFRATGTEVWMPHFTAFLGEACEVAGQMDEASMLFDDALRIGEKTGERWLDAELYRHKGQLLLRQGHIDDAEELYHKALSVAQEQEAKLWELRAAVSLARLRGDQGRRAEAHDLLAPVYGWFTEGFATPDLKEAKALLDELA